MLQDGGEGGIEHRRAVELLDEHLFPRARFAFAFDCLLDVHGEGVGPVGEGRWLAREREDGAQVGRRVQNRPPTANDNEAARTPRGTQNPIGRLAPTGRFARRRTSSRPLVGGSRNRFARIVGGSRSERPGKADSEKIRRIVGGKHYGIDTALRTQRNSPAVGRCIPGHLRMFARLRIAVSGVGSQRIDRLAGGELRRAETLDEHTA